MDKSQRNRQKHVVTKLITAAALVTATLLADSRYRIVNSHISLKYDTLPREFDGFKIIHLTDLHMKSYGKNNHKVLDIIKSEKPDIIVITGDFINRKSKGCYGGQTEKLRPLMQNIAKIAPCYFVCGNHEWSSCEILKFTDMIRDTGIKYLENEYVRIERNGEYIIIAGVVDRKGSKDKIKPNELVDIIKNKYPDDFIIFLGHRNDWIEKYPDLPVNIIFSGHAHGGVIRLPIIGGIIGTNISLFPQYDAGLYNEGKYDLIISRGLGGDEPIPRFMNNPEIITALLRKSF